MVAIRRLPSNAVCVMSLVSIIRPVVTE